MKASRFAAALLLASAASVATGPVPTAAPVATASGTSWTATQSAGEAYAPAAGWDNQTLRMVVRTSLGGTSLRIRLTDAFATNPAVIGHVTVGTQLNGGTTAESTPTTVTFGGAQAVTIPAGGAVASDPVAFTVAPNTRLLVSIYVPSGAGMATAPRHDLADETNFNFSGGDASTDQYFPTTNTFSFVALLDGIDVSSAAPSTVIAVGDSITDGLGTASDTDTRWPNYLAARAASSGLAVIDQGIGGNEVTADQGASGQSLLNRWNRDVLNQPGVRTVVDADGINDLRNNVSAAALETAQTTLATSAHAAGLKFLLSTITPCAGETKCTVAVQQQIAVYNAWVRGGAGGIEDAFTDPDAAVDAGGALKPVYDSGDHLHPNSAGAAALANAVPVGAL